MENVLKGIFDMHVHTAPDVINRKYTDFELVDAAVRVEARGIVIKSHQGSTVERAFLCNEYNKKVYGNNDFKMYGGIVLNFSVGGINPKAVKTALKLGAKEVWLPTIHSKNDMQKHGKSGGIEVLDNQGNVIESLKEIMRMIKDEDIVLATGHISPKEIFRVVEEARKIGVKKIVITHPEFWVVGLSHEEQKELVNTYDVILEKCYRQPLIDGTWKNNYDDTLKLIEEIGWKNIMADTDGGQVINPVWEKEMADYINFFYEHGISEEAVKHMTQEIPARLLSVNI